MLSLYYKHREQDTEEMKNPYEIRLDVLKMAKEMMDRQYEANYEAAMQSIKFMKEAGKPFTGNFDSYVPDMYKPESVMEKAQELYQFIIKKD
jgi:tRNA A58 N-methylase Trm61